MFRQARPFLSMLFATITPFVTSVELFAVCDIILPIASSGQSCGCQDSACTNPSEETINSHLVCDEAPATVSGQEGCQSRSVVTGTLSDCYEGTDWWAMVRCLAGQTACSAALIACATVCVSPPWAQCAGCLLMHGACEAALVSQCAAPCVITKCYVDEDSERSITSSVFDKFDPGDDCTGGGSESPS